MVSNSRKRSKKIRTEKHLMAFITIGQSYFIFVGVASAKWWKKHPECSGLTNDKREGSGDCSTDNFSRGAGRKTKERTMMVGRGGVSTERVHAKWLYFLLQIRGDENRDIGFGQ